jgi:uncharacterized membrane protein YkvA (DUF1232 family)
MKLPIPEKLRLILRDAKVLWIASRDPRTPVRAKAVAAAVAAYALSPVDAIPDFLPLIGWLDDFVLVPLGIRYAMRLIPPDLLAEFRARAENSDDPSIPDPARPNRRRKR